MTEEERTFIKTNVSFGFASHNDFESIPEGEFIPFTAVPNMICEDGSVRVFSWEEILEALRGVKNDLD